MATVKILHTLVKANPGLLSKIRAYFETMFIFDEQDEYTIYQVEKPDKIGNIEIILEFAIVENQIVVSGFRPAAN